MPSGRLRVGIIGCGWVARVGHLPALARLEDVEIVAVADSVRERLEHVGASFGITRHYSDHRDLVEDPTVDAVAVCVPAESHVEVAHAAVEAGKHVLLEKPPALTLGGWDRLAAAVDRAGVSLMVGMSMRWHPAFRAARDLVRTGRLGEIHGVRTVLTNDSLDQPDAPDWRAERRRGGGALVEMGVHHLDLWRFLLDAEVEEVFAHARGDDESIAVSGRMKNGVPASSLFSHRTGHINEIDVYGDAAHVRASPYSAPRLLPVSIRPWTIRAKLREAGAAMSLPHALRGRRQGGFFVGAFIAEWRHFVDAVRDGAPVEVGLDSARNLLRTMLATAASATEGRPVRCADSPPTLAQGEAVISRR